jgi:Glycosyl hydrolases family 25
MTIQFPDVSSYTKVSLAGAPVVIARATIGVNSDSYYGVFKADARDRRIPFSAYHFLNAGSLGHSAAEQADWAFTIIGPGVPTMLDLEPNRGACASLAEGLAWIDRFRARGGVCHLCYLPRWVWSGYLGSPDLGGLRSRGVHLVASHYTTYQEPWPADTSYGGSKADQWQWADNHPFNGGLVDWNAALMTVAEYWDMVTGSPAPTTRGDKVLTLFRVKGTTPVYVSDGIQCRWLQGYQEYVDFLNWARTNWKNLYNNGQIVDVSQQDFDALAGILIGPQPPAG